MNECNNRLSSACHCSGVSVPGASRECTVVRGNTNAQDSNSGHHILAPTQEPSTPRYNAQPCLHKTCAFAVMPPAQGGTHVLGTILIQVSSRLPEPPLNRIVADFKVSCCLGVDRLESKSLTSILRLWRMLKQSSYLKSFSDRHLWQDAQFVAV